MNHFRRFCLLVPVALLAAAPVLAPGSASAAQGSSLREEWYVVKLSGTQLTNWSYNYVAPRLDCTTTYTGRGSERYDFTSPRFGAVVRVIDGEPSIEQSTGLINISKSIEGTAKYFGGGASHCPTNTYAVDQSGCGTRSLKGSFGLLFRGRHRLTNWLSDGGDAPWCPSAANGTTDGSGGRSLLKIGGHVYLRSLLRAHSTAVHGEKTVRKDIKYGTTKIGEEVTTIQWTLHFRRR